VSLDDPDSEPTLDSPTREELARELREVREVREEVEELRRGEQEINREYLKALIRQVLHEMELTAEREREEMEAASLPIQQIARLPDSVAREQLEPTHQRARFVWKRYEELSHKVRDGRVLKAGELRKILQAREDEDAKIYTATVGRVMDAVVDLTHGIAKVNESEQGERRLYVPNDWKRQAEQRDEEH
jgi:hypothetical protein